MKRLLPISVALSILLAACTVYVRPTPSSSVNVRPVPSRPSATVTVTDYGRVTQFSPTRGKGSIYRLGEAISFYVEVSNSGYLSLTSTGADGVSSTFASGIYVVSGTTQTLPTPESRVSFNAAPPRGLQRVTVTLSSDAAGRDVLDSATTDFYIE